MNLPHDNSQNVPIKVGLKTPKPCSSAAAYDAHSMSQNIIYGFRKNYPFQSFFFLRTERRNFILFCRRLKASAA